MSVTINRE